MSLTVIFPCYNEEASVEKVVGKALSFVNEKIDDYEILIIDDGSEDATGDIADSLARKNKHVRVFHHEKNEGYGAAIRTGFKNSAKDLVFFTDSDGQFDIKDLDEFLPLINEYDMVIGYRLSRSDSFARKIYSALWNGLVNTMLRLGAKDVNCAFKLFRKEVLADMRLRSTGFFINAEILALAKRNGCRIKRLGVRHYGRMGGRATGFGIKAMMLVLKELCALRSSLV